MRHGAMASHSNGQGRRSDLFDRIDTSSRYSDLSATYHRKRKAAEMDPRERGSDRRVDSVHRQPFASPSLDLGSMLIGHARIPPEVYDRIQGVLFAQDRKIQELGQTIQEREQDIRSRNETIRDRERDNRNRNETVIALRKRVEGLEREKEREKERTERHVAANELTSKHLRERKDELERQVKEKDGFFTMGTKALTDKTESVQRLEEENRRLRQTVTDRDTTISRLHQEIWAITGPDHVNLDDRAKAVVAAQASATLTRINGLEADKQSRDECIKVLQAEIRELKPRAEAARTGNETNNNLQRKIEDLQRELKQQTQKTERAAERATKARETAEEQQRLIEKLLEENKRLGLVDGRKEYK